MIMTVPVQGQLAENCYCYIDEATGHGFLIDPGAEAEKIAAAVEARGWTIEKILLTHGHFDHFGAADELRTRLGVPIYGFVRTDEVLLNPELNLSALFGLRETLHRVRHLWDGDLVGLEGDTGFDLRVIHTPGHSTDSVTYYSERDHAAFVGDLIMKGSLGSPKYPGGDEFALEESVYERVLALPGETVLYPGHSAPTTVAAERARLGVE
jgi:glyoxylase-like metal-dependent hydrolase (beta-lactamase superfamily II)